MLATGFTVVDGDFFRIEVAERDGDVEGMVCVVKFCPEEINDNQLYPCKE